MLVSPRRTKTRSTCFRAPSFFFRVWGNMRRSIYMIELLWPGVSRDILVASMRKKGGPYTHTRAVDAETT